MDNFDKNKLWVDGISYRLNKTRKQVLSVVKDESIRERMLSYLDNAISSTPVANDNVSFISTHEKWGAVSNSLLKSVERDINDIVTANNLRKSGFDYDANQIENQFKHRFEVASKRSQAKIAARNKRIKFKTDAKRLGIAITLIATIAASNMAVTYVSEGIEDIKADNYVANVQEVDKHSFIVNHEGHYDYHYDNQAKDVLSAENPDFHLYTLINGINAKTRDNHGSFDRSVYDRVISEISSRLSDYPDSKMILKVNGCSSMEDFLRLNNFIDNEGNVSYEKYEDYIRALAEVEMQIANNIENAEMINNGYGK